LTKKNDYVIICNRWRSIGEKIVKGHSLKIFFKK